MKTVLALLLGVFINQSKGLSCYQCVYIEGIGDINNPLWDTNCLGVPNSPDRLIDCDDPLAKIFHKDHKRFLDQTEVLALKQVPFSYACAKVYADEGGIKSVGKGCDIAEEEKKDFCIPDTYEGLTGEVCHCHSDKCNSAVELKASVMIFLTFISKLFL